MSLDDLRMRHAAEIPPSPRGDEDHRVTRIEQLAIGDVLELHSNVNVSPQYPHGWMQHVLLQGRVYKPTDGRRVLAFDVEVVMDYAQLTESFAIYVETSGPESMDVHVTNITPRYIVANLVRNDGSIAHNDLIMTRDHFKFALLRSPSINCYKKQTSNPWWNNPMDHAAENPSGATTGDEDQAFNPSADVRMNKYLVNCVY